MRTDNKTASRAQRLDLDRDLPVPRGVAKRLARAPAAGSGSPAFRDQIPAG
jgi:hypothetical protein